MSIPGKKMFNISSGDALYPSIAIFIFGVISSLIGASIFKVDLYTFSDNLIIANLMYITFIILLNERVLESYNSSCRKPYRLTLISEIDLIEKEIELIKGKPDDSPPAEYADPLVRAKKLEELNVTLIKKKENLCAFRLQTRRQLLVLSLFIGGFISSMGCLNVLTPLIDQTLFIGHAISGSEQFSIEGLHKALFEGGTVLFSSWLIAGGSEGWNSVTSWAEKAVNPKKV